MMSYLGWTQMHQGLLDSAKATLDSAIGIEVPAERAPAHCLLAQVFQLQAGKQQQFQQEERELLKQAKHEWETCRTKQNGTEDEINWSEQATKAVPAIDARLGVLSAKQ